MSIEEKKTFVLSWDAVGDSIAEQLTAILDAPIKCIASSDDIDYWTASLCGHRLLPDELERIFDAVGADEEMRKDILEEEENSFENIGMLLSSRLLEISIGYNWETCLIYPNALWLIGCSGNDCICIAGRSISLAKLKSKDELMRYLSENGPTHTSLMDFCDEYREKYRNELCWDYPISDGKHLGIFLVLVKEGILSLPYDDADKVDYEIFKLEDTRMFTESDEIADFITDWDNYANELRQAMKSMLIYLSRKEKKQNA